MRFLADESVEALVVEGLRRAGHEVAAVSEVDSGVEDSRVLKRARREGRILVTNDKDFAALSFLRIEASAGIVLVRLPGSRSARKAARLLEVVEQLGETLRRGITVVEETACRRRAFPSRR